MWSNCSYPAIRLTNPGDGYFIAGAIFEVAGADLATLDAREGVAHGWYRRIGTTRVKAQGMQAYEGAQCLYASSGPSRAWHSVGVDASGVDRRAGAGLKRPTSE